MKKGVFAVRFQSAWAAVVVRNKLNKQRTKTRLQRRPACTLTGCAKDHWTCPHATSVAHWCSDLWEATLAVMAGNPTFVDPFTAFSDEQRGRCSRNLRPCAG